MTSTVNSDKRKYFNFRTIIAVLLILSITLTFSAFPVFASDGTVASESVKAGAKTYKWYVFKELKLALKTPTNFTFYRSKDRKGDYEGHNDKLRITIKKWKYVSYPKIKDLNSLVKEHTKRKTKVITRNGKKLVKVLGFSKKIKYFFITPSGDDYILIIRANTEKHPKLRFSEVRDEAKLIEKSIRTPKKVPLKVSKKVFKSTRYPKVNYKVLVNSSHRISEKWLDKVDIVSGKNTRGNTFKAERRTYKAYLKLKHKLETKDDIHIDIDYGLRTVKEQKDLIKDYTRQYGAAYANRIAAKPGYSEHHTGLALDIYLIIDGKEIYLNEDMEKYPKVWAKIHKRLADYGFILRYPKNTSYPYEPWHIRYVGKKAAKEIMDNLPMTLEQYLSKG